MKQSDFARKVLTSASTAGWTFEISQTNDEAEYTHATLEEVMQDLEATDSLRVYCTQWDAKTRQCQQGWLYFVWQGPDQRYQEGEEILSDYTTNLDFVEGCYDN